MWNCEIGKFKEVFTRKMVQMLTLWFLYLLLYIETNYYLSAKVPSPNFGRYPRSSRRNLKNVNRHIRKVHDQPSGTFSACLVHEVLPLPGTKQTQTDIHKK